MSANYKERHTAYLVRIGELLHSHLVKEAADKPSSFYIEQRQLNVSRVNLIGFVVSKDTHEQGYEEFILDDGSGEIAVRNFDTSVVLRGMQVGTLVRLIGRVREYNGERYIIPEIIRPLKDRRLLQLHMLELKATITPRKQEEPAKKESAEQGLDETSPKQLVYELIKELDDGSGVELQLLASKTQLKDIDSIVESLIKMGDIFMVGPGRVKVL